MADIERVIKGIRKCLSQKPCQENGCPYENECAVEHINAPLLRDALELLKEQQPKKGYWISNDLFIRDMKRQRTVKNNADTANKETVV